MSDDESSGVIAELHKATEASGWRTKVGKVLFQLGMGTNKAAALYEGGRDALDTIEGRSLVNRALAEAVAQQAISDPEIMERAKARFLRDVHSRQENLEAVLCAAEGQMLALPPPADDQAAQPDDRRLSHSPEEREEPELDVDWAASFTLEAEKATSSDLRDRLARVLAGEVRSPGSFPRAILRTIVELERADLEAVETALVCRYLNALHLELLPEPTAKRTLRILSDAGLIHTTLISHAGIDLLEDGTGHFISILPRGDVGLLIQTNKPQLLGKNTQLLTKAGNAVFDLVDNISDLDFLRRFARSLIGPEINLLLGSVNRAAGHPKPFSLIEVVHQGIAPKAMTTT